MGSSESTGSASKGADWKSTIYFDPEADSGVGASYYIGDSQLRQKLSSLVYPSEYILKITIYKTPLSEIQLTDSLLYHVFIVFETSDWWWSIEKNSEGITLQRSKIMLAVREYYRRKKRIKGTSWSIEEIVHDKGRRTLNQLIDFLWKSDELNRKYSWLNSNCKGFAKRIFDEVAERKTWNYA